jgi:hypothetical protein
MQSRRTSETGDGVAVGIVHNQKVARNDYLFPHVEALMTALSHRHSVVRMEAWSQPELQPHRVGMALLRDFLYFQLEREWSRYRLLPVKSPIRAARVFFKNAIKKYASPSEATFRWMRNSQIETIVTDKHIRIWQQFLDTDMRYLVVFEDDAVFKDDSIKRFSALHQRLSLINQDVPIYIDLGGGCTVDQLAVSKLESRQEPGFRHYKKPTTNTACAYMLNRATVKLFVQHLVRRPWLRLIGIDWMMNKLFILSDIADDQFYCTHTDPTMFQHGSTTGHYTTWQAD